MTPALRVLSAGMLTTVQDRGRVGHQRLGIPVSGALDLIALRVANLLAGNPDGMAALELSLLGPTLEVEAESVRVALCGTAAGIEVLAPEPARVPSLQSVRLVRGQRFRVAGFGDSAAAYLAIEGGLALAPILGSLSTHLRAGLGPLDGRTLQAGDRLPLALAGVEERPEVRLPSGRLPGTRQARFRVVLGPQDDLFAREHIATFLSATYRVAKEADRMGMRLDGPALVHTISIVSDGIAPGAIQVPAGGQPIVLLADRQTTGGYPKIATVISADLPALARLRPGAPVAFEAVSVAQAEAARRTLEAELARLRDVLEPIGATREFDPSRLALENLISGVVSAGHVD
jgi:allophanate hydrolase